MSSSDNPSSDLDLGATIRGFSADQRLFDRYALVRILGRGGMGVVWLARDEKLDRDVALKFLPELVVRDSAMLDELKRETKRSLQLTHHHIVRIYDFTEDEQSACISMEYVDGPTLSALRVQRPEKAFEVEELATWVRQTCEALDYAHSVARIVHRDLKPANLMLNSHVDVKVADFGIARSLSDSVSMLTMARGASGTLVYMSPQQLHGERASHFDDVYSLGATLYELLTSKPPFFSGDIPGQIEKKIPSSIAERRTELEVALTDVPPAWEQTIAACLAKDPAQRPQSAREIAGRLGLTDFAAVTFPDATKASKKAAPTRSTSAPKRIAIIGLAILMFAGGGLITWRWKIDRPNQPEHARGSLPRNEAPVTTPSATEGYPEEVLPPTPKAYFNDYAEVVSKATALELNEQLAQLERETTSQFVVAIFRKMNSQRPIKDFTLATAKAWGVGQKKRANGVVLFVFTEDKKMYLQVGSGLTAFMPDTKCQQILDTVMKPRLKTGDYETGIREGVSAVLQAIGPAYRSLGETTGLAAGGGQGPIAQPVTSPGATQAQTNDGDQRLVRFTNQQYRYSALVPMSVLPNPPQREDERRVKFVSPDGATELELRVENQASGVSIGDIYRSWISERTRAGSIGYQTRKGNWFVISGDEGGRGYYIKAVLRDHDLITLNLTYDEQNCPIWKETFTAMSRGFTGDIGTEVWRGSIEQFVQRYVAINQAKDLGELLKLFAPSVDYFDEGFRDQTHIQHDFINYTARWPIRQETIQGDIRVEERLPGREYLASFKLNFYVASEPRREWIRGQFNINLTVAIFDGAPKVVGIKESVVRREKGKL